VLMGLRGCGKSTVGAILAREWNRRFVDLDDRTLDTLRSRHGATSIADAFERFGEAAFRDAEAEALREVLDDHDLRNAVIALGGGTPTAPGAADALRSSASVLVYLRPSVEELKRRLAGEIDSRRPALLPGRDPVSEIATVFDQRDPLYRQLAAIVIEGEDSPAVIAERIRTAIEERG